MHHEHHYKEELEDLIPMKNPRLDDLDDDIGDLDDLELEGAQALAVQWLMTHRHLEVRRNLLKTREFSTYKNPTWPR